MRPARGRLFRPLLGVTRADVRRFLAERGLPFMVDRTNADLAFARNRIRRLVLPFLAAEFNPRLGSSLASLAARLRDEEDFLAAAAAARAAGLVGDDPLPVRVAADPPAPPRRSGPARSSFARRRPATASASRASAPASCRTCWSTPRCRARPVRESPCWQLAVRSCGRPAWRAAHAPRSAPTPAASSRVFSSPSDERSGGCTLLLRRPYVTIASANFSCTEARLNPISRNFGLWLLLLLMGLLLWSIVTKQQPREPEVSYSRFVEAVDEGRVAEVTIQGKNIRGRYRGEHGEPGEGFKTFTPEDPDLVKMLREKNVTIDARPEDAEPWYFVALVQWAPMLLLVGVWIFFMRQMQVGGGKAMSFGKSRAKLLSENTHKVTFNDVAGIDEAKEELEEIIAFLKDP